MYSLGSYLTAKRDCSQAWLNEVSSGVNYAQQAKMYLASDAAIVTISASSTATHTTTSTSQAIPTTHSTTTALSFVTCPAGCIPISSASTTISILPASSTTSAGVGSSAASGCPIAGEICESGAMACDGYYYGQCANGVWVVRQCASGLACFSEDGAVYCDWASNGVITSCSGSTSSKVKRDTDEYSVALVGGNSSSAMMDSSSAAASSGASGVAGTSADPYEEDESETGGALLVTDTQYTDVIITTTISGTTVTDDLLQITPMPYLFNSSTSSVDPPTMANSTTSSSPSLLPTSAGISYSTNNTSSASATSAASAIASSSAISGDDISSSGPTPPTNVSLSIQALNTTNFVAVLQASTLNNTPILTDWSFSFKSEYQILTTNRGNLSLAEDSVTYTITSIAVQEPSVNMAIVVRLWGIYDSSTSSGMIGSTGVENVDSGSSGNETFALFRRAFSWLN
jgi:hypothetical protein